MFGVEEAAEVDFVDVSAGGVFGAFDGRGGRVGEVCACFGDGLDEGERG